MDSSVRGERRNEARLRGWWERDTHTSILKRAHSHCPVMYRTHDTDTPTQVRAGRGAITMICEGSGRVRVCMRLRSQRGRESNLVAWEAQRREGLRKRRERRESRERPSRRRSMCAGLIWSLQCLIRHPLIFYIEWYMKHVISARWLRWVVLNGNFF